MSRVSFQEPLFAGAVVRPGGPEGSSAYGNPPAPELISTLPEQATGYKMLLRIGTSHYSNTWYPYSSLGGGAVS